MKITRAIKSLALAGILALSLTISAFAAGQAEINSAVSAASSSGMSAEQIQAAVEGAGATTDASKVDSSSAINFSAGGKIYYVNGSDAQSIVNALKSGASDKEEADKANEKTAKQAQELLSETGDLKGLYVEADLGGAAGALSGFTPLISLISGILAAAAILGVTVFTSVDVCYLAFPVAHAKIEKKGSEGGAMSTQRKDGGGSKFALVTDDAIYAYETAQQNNQQPWGLYLKRRALTIILISIVIYILLTGNMTLLINWTLNMVGGIIDQLNKLATSVNG